MNIKNTASADVFISGWVVIGRTLRLNHGAAKKAVAVRSESIGAIVSVSDM